ncbi:MAG: hypothetical protein RIF33_23420 [Cyclobacteriaceae bacterium]
MSLKQLISTTLLSINLMILSVSCGSEDDSTTLDDPFEDLPVSNEFDGNYVGVALNTVDVQLGEMEISVSNGDVSGQYRFFDFGEGSGQESISGSVKDGGRLFFPLGEGVENEISIRDGIITGTWSDPEEEGVVRGALYVPDLDGRYSGQFIVQNPASENETTWSIDVQGGIVRGVIETENNSTPGSLRGYSAQLASGDNIFIYQVDGGGALTFPRATLTVSQEGVIDGFFVDATGIGGMVTGTKEQ